MSATVAAEGLLSVPLQAGRLIIANSLAFQRGVGANTVEEALLRVHLITTPTVPARPFALLDFGDFIRDRYVTANDRPFQQRNGSTAVAYFTQDVLNDMDEPDAALTFMNWLGAVWEDIERRAGDYSKASLAVVSIELLVAPTRIVAEKRERAGDYYEAALGLTFTRRP